MINEILVKSVLNKHKKRDNWFLENYTLNPYSGCSFNCIYCYIQGSKYGGDVSNNLSIKVNAPEILIKQLKRRAFKREYGIIAVGSSTDPYLAIEEKLGLTQELLQIIYRFKFPVHIITKSNLILRDLNILMKINAGANLPVDLKPKLNHGVIVSFSFSTMDEKLAKIFEPCAPSPMERLETILKLKEEGFLVGVNLMPVLPFLSDSEENLDKMIKEVKFYGADFVMVGGLTLFGDKSTDCKVRYFEILEKYFPEILDETKNLFKNSFAPPKNYQMTILKRSKRICKKYNIKNSII
ncbi:MAG: radical SAM protein [Methanobacterium sp.]